jgi:tellurite resistance protein
LEWLLQNILTVNHPPRQKGKGMPSDNQDRRTTVFDRETYVKMLIAIARADKNNSLSEYRFIRKQAIQLGVDYEQVLKETDRDFEIGTHNVSRLTALRVLKDAIMIASMDGNFTLPEKEKLYTYAEKLDIPRTEVDHLETLVGQLKALDQRWKELVAGHPDE